LPPASRTASSQLAGIVRGKAAATGDVTTIASDKKYPLHAVLPKRI
jgi:hypothetical protein